MHPGELLRSRTFRLAMLYAGLFAGSALLLLGFIYWSTVGYMADQADATIEADIRGLAERYREQGLEGLVQTINLRLERDPDMASVYLLTTGSYAPLAGNLSAWPEAEPDTERWLSFEFRDPRTEDRMFQARARAFRLEGGLRLLVGRDVRELRATRQLIVRALLWGSAMMLVLAVSVGLFMSRRSQRRLEEISQTTREIIDGDLARRVPSDGSGDELDRLADSLNAMLDEIQRLMDGIRHVTDNVAHDLRTPLTRLRNRLEGLRDQLDAASPQRDVVEEGLAETDQLLATFAALLRIARLEAGGRTARFVELDLGALADDAVELYAAVAEARGQTLELKCDAPVRVVGDRDLLFQALTNLIDNAIKYTPQGGRVALEIEPDDAGITLTVADSGPGIPADAYDKVTERFFRLEQSRTTPGSGLGLSLVAAVARLHRARLRFADGRPGLRVSLVFERKHGDAR